MLLLIWPFVAYAVLGAFAGILAGLLGIGGGIITVPGLLLIFHFLGFPVEQQMLIAIGTSLAAMVFNTAGSMIAHHRKGNVIWAEFRKMALGLVIGSVVGAFIATWLSGVVLEIVFGAFLIALAYRFYTKSTPLKEHIKNHLSKC